MNAPDQSDGSEPIEDDEILYRRIPVSQDWYDPNTEPPLSYLAYKPSRRDETGLSLTRAKYSNIEQAAHGTSAQGYFVGKLRAKELRITGISVVPAPFQDQPGHCEIPSLRADNRKSNEAIEQANLLARKLTFEVEGPFLNSGPPLGL